MKKLTAIMALILSICLLASTVCFADEVKPASELTAEDVQLLSEVPFGVLPFSQEFVSWQWRPYGDKVVGKLGETIECVWTDTQDIAVFGAEHTNNFTSCPNFVLQLSDAGYLKLPDAAQPGDTGDTGVYSVRYTDITITVDGYDDVVVPGGQVDNYRLTIKQEAGWVSGTEHLIDLGGQVRSQLGLDIEQFCEYLTHISSISTTATFLSFNGYTAEDLEVYYASIEEFDLAKLEELSPYVEILENAKAVIDDESSDLEAKKSACADATDAIDNIYAEIAGLVYPKCQTLADDWAVEVKNMQTVVMKLEADAKAEAEAAAEAEKPEESKKPEAESSSSSSESASGVVVVIVVIVVVIVAIIAAAVLMLSKKKKA